jgi:hypothetical protein
MAQRKKHDSNHGEPLKLRKHRGGSRYYLEGSPVRQGDVLHLLQAGDEHITGLFQWSGNPKDRPQFFYYDKNAFGVRSIFLATLTPLSRRHVADSWTRRLSTQDSLDGAEELLHRIIEASDQNNGDIRGVAAAGDFRKLLCKFQLLRRKSLTRR